MGDGFAEVVALDLVANMLSKEPILFRRFNPFSDDRKVQRFSHSDNGLGNCIIFGVLGNLADERAIYLQYVNREPLEKCHRRIAGPEIINSQPYAELFNGSE